MSVELNNAKSPASGLLGDEFFDAEDGEALKISDDELLSKINRELSDVADIAKADTNELKAPNADQCRIAKDPIVNDDKCGMEVEENSSISLSKQIEEDIIKEESSVEKEFEKLLEQESDAQSKTKDDDDLLNDTLSDIEDVDSKANEIEAKIDALLNDDPKIPLTEVELEAASTEPDLGISEITKKETETLPTAEVLPEDVSLPKEHDLDAAAAPVEEKPADSEEKALEETADGTTDKLLDEDLREDDLLEDCVSSDVPTTLVSDNANGKMSESETSSSNGDTPEESDAEKQFLNQVEAGVEAEQDKLEEKMEVDDDCSTVEDKLMLCVVAKEDEKPSADLKDPTIVKFNFMRKFASKIGKLSRPELEELLVQKIAEAMIFGSENCELRTRIESQETINEGIKKQLENVKKQYKDLQMIHERVMKDLKDRPEAPITPVKITRAVGLQVYQPALRVKNATPPQSGSSLIKRTLEPTINGSSPPEAKRKKTVKTTPLRPPLSDKQRAAVARQEATEELKLRTKTMKTVMNVTVPSSITVVPLGSLQNGNKGSSIDLTDDPEDINSNRAKAHQPPPLTAIRAANLAAGKSVPVPKMPTGQTIQVRQNQVRIPYNVIAPNIAPLPPTPNQNSRPGWKKVPPRPVIKISKVNSGIIVSWFLENLSPEQHANILSYQIYAYEQSSNGPALTENWRHVGDVKSLALPMAVTLTQFQEGRKYYFAVRAQDCYKRFTNFSLPRTWA